MTQPTYVPDPANRWATEHYGFADDAGAATRRPGGTRGSLPTADRSARPRIKNRLAATIVGIALVSGAGGAAIASRASHVHRHRARFRDRHASARRWRRIGRTPMRVASRSIGALLFVGALLLGVWLGLTAVDVSPVTSQFAAARTMGPGR